MFSYVQDLTCILHEKFNSFNFRLVFVCKLKYVTLFVRQKTSFKCPKCLFSSSFTMKFLIKTNSLQIVKLEVILNMQNCRQDNSQYYNNNELSRPWPPTHGSFWADSKKQSVKKSINPDFSPHFIRQFNNLN